MNIYSIINDKRSVRAYKRDKIDQDIIRKVIGAAGRAPSWANRQCWRFVAVSSSVTKKIIGKASGQDNIAKACEDAPYIIVLCAAENESGVKNGMAYFMFDCGLAMENLVLAAQAEGLATCIVGWFDEKAVKAVLNVPDGFRVIAFTPLGYANENVPVRSRKKENDILYYNHWGNHKI